MSRSRRRQANCAIGAFVIPVAALILEALFCKFETCGAYTIIGLMLGAACAANVFVTPRLKITAVLIYIPAVLVVMMFAALCIACAQGNCI